MRGHAPARLSSWHAVQVLRKDYSEYREAMRRLFNEVDPIALIKGGAPHDEYDPEIGDLLKWPRPVTADQVVDVFQRWFGMPISQVDAQRLAQGIAQIRDAFGYPTE